MEAKKNKQYELESRRPLFFGIGMMISLSLTILAFEWKSPIDKINILDDDNKYIDETVYIPPTTITPPPPPPPKAVEVIEVVDKEDDAIDPPVIDAEATENDIPEIVIPQVDFSGGEEPEEAPRSFAEVMPSYEGGMQNFYRFIADNIKYPKQAQRMGVEGKVFVQFVVEKDGSLSNIQAVKGIGAGCDEEAVRVMKMVSSFIPAKQGDLRVRIQMVVPISFQLQ